MTVVAKAEEHRRNVAVAKMEQLESHNPGGGATPTLTARPTTLV